MEEKILKQEQEHLTTTYEKLLKMNAALEDDIRNLDNQATEEKNDIRDNIRLDFADDETKAETYGELEVWNRYIDTYNVQSEALRNKKARIESLLKAPYFAKITLQFDPSEEPESYYIGNVEMSENGATPIVVDWRSPIAEVYYNQENGHTFYEVNGNRIDVDLQLRRQFDLDKDKLNSYFDTQVAIEDPLLLRSLSRQRSDKMQSISATIQKEQNAVIRHPDVPALLVSGIAGSGKTSVLLQRIAYLFYKQRENLRPDQVYMITLNPVFREYIDSVLPDLGESNPNTLTWQEFMDSCSIPMADKNPAATDAKDLEAIDDMLSLLAPDDGDFLPVYQKDELILSAREVQAVVEKYAETIPVGVRLMQVAATELEAKARQVFRGRKRDNHEKQQGEEKAAENQLENDYGGALKTIRNCGWLNYNAISKRLIGHNPSAIEWFYLKMSLTGMCDRNARYCMVDEVQNYTKAQMMVLKKYFPRAKFMLLGDEFQAIRPGTVTFKELEDLFSTDRKSTDTISLLTSYRSSPEITALFTSLLPEEVRINTQSVQREGTEPVVRALKAEEYIKALRETIIQNTDSEGLCAVVCQNKKSLNYIKDILENDAPEVITGDKKLPKEGVILIELAHAAGLEFDSVIIPDADAQRYPDDILSKHRLYTAMSRATRRITLLSEGKMTPLIQTT
ncbi:MAG: UvrD-helicase domain-containing protein [Butyrivibrio sp.]|uniref:HelD family protein n=1 Tax=Butyrivibrio sp. TaxID=28121 RepID=UPI0025F268E1|nr:UvrD-helicase domain-containing protein [Butyrivibrio sp.]MCR5772095.1 UvrD-helicase domain-containing protein [Butyrivibrio sp.]